MKLGEIKIEALRLMFVNYSERMTVEKLPDLENDEKYSSYLENMGGSIQRALDRIVNAGKMPTKVLTLTDGEQVGLYHKRYDLSDIPDFSSVVRVVADGDYFYNPNVQYMLEGRDTLIVRAERVADYRLVYRTKAPNISGLEDTDELPIDDELSRLIPYFIKYDLYQEEEPQLSAQALTIFEQMLKEIDTKDKANQTRIKVVFSA